MTAPVLEATGYEFTIDEHAAMLFTNIDFGNVVPNPDLGESWQVNRPRAIEKLQKYTTATQVVRTKTPKAETFTDLDFDPPAPESVHENGDRLYRTNGFVTSQQLIMNANPADCLIIGANGFSKTEDRQIYGMFHAGWDMVDQHGHGKWLKHFEERGVALSSLSLMLTPSARKDSYRLDKISDNQRTSPRWRDFLAYREGLWSVDFHGLVIRELEDLNIPRENMQISPVDTISNENYYSHYRRNKEQKAKAPDPENMTPKGFNGVFFAPRIVASIKLLDEVPDLAAAA